MRKIFIVNPAAATCPPDLEVRIRARFPQAEVHRTRTAGDGTVLAKRLLERESGSHGLFVACGGDGTFREVATGVGTRATLAVLPLGTVNLVPTELGIPLGLDGALDLLEYGTPVPVFPGRCVADGAVNGRLFFIAVSAGPDADAVCGVGPVGKRLLGRYSYVLQLLRRLMTPVRAAIRVIDGPETTFCSEFLALRMPCYGGRYRVGRRARLSRTHLETIAIRGGRRAVLRFFWNVYRSRLVDLPGVNRTMSAAVKVVLPRRTGFQVDGDGFQARCLKLSVDSDPITVMAESPVSPGLGSLTG